MSRFDSRRAQLRKLVRKEGGDAILVTSFTNVTYLTGFTGDDSYLLVAGKNAIVISDPRYTTQLEEECPDVTVHIRPPGKSMLEGIAEAVRGSKVSNLAIEADSMSVALHAQLEAKLAKTKLVPAAGLVEQLRAIKDKQEIEEICLAARYAEKGFAILRATLRPERTEKEIAADLEYQLRLLAARLQLSADHCRRPKVGATACAADGPADRGGRLCIGRLGGHGAAVPERLDEGSGDR